MIKAFALVPRRADLTSEEFHDHYRHPHGTIGVNNKLLRGYVQSHHIHTDRLGADQAEFEAVAEMWYDNLATLSCERPLADLVEYIRHDEPRFADLDRVEFFATTEEVLISAPPYEQSADISLRYWSVAQRPTTVKLLHFVRPDGAPQWSTDADEDIGRRLGAYRQVRCTTVGGVRGGVPGPVGVHELWWPTRTAFHVAVAADPDALAELIGRSARSITLLAQAERFI